MRGPLIPWLLSQPLFWAVLGVIFGPVFFLRGFRLLQRKRLIMDIPSSSVRGAAMGPVELHGKAAGPYTIVAPASQTDCLYYRMFVEANPEGDLRHKAGELCAPLFLDDGTGKVMIFPEGAELQIPNSSERTDYVEVALAAATRSAAGRPEFSQEYCIRPGDELFLLGTLQENPWAKRNPRAETSELSRIGPGFVSQAEADIMEHAACPALDPALPAGVAVASPEEFDLHPPVILMKGAGPFVISTRSQREVVARLHWKSLLYIWGGPAAALWGLWEILTKARGAGLLPGSL